MSEIVRSAPPFDKELLPALATGAVAASIDLAGMISLRSPTQLAGVDAMLDARGLVREDRRAPGRTGDPDVTLSIIRRRGGPGGGPGIYFAHGGGMVMGDRFHGLDRVLDWIERFGAVLVTVEYRRAPEHPDPAPLDDCTAGMVWTATHAEELGFDPARLIAVGLSAGAGLIAGSALRARDAGDAGWPPLAAQVLLCPMLDDRNDSVSSHQFQGTGVWDRSSNAAGWRALLGDRQGTERVSAYSAPARATDLSGLPPSYIDCGSAEVFRDEAVAYAGAIWAAGGVAELHVWAGGFHGFDGLAPGAAISRAARSARTGFLDRLLTAPG